MVSAVRDLENLRLDTFLTHKNKNLAMLELKAPSEALTKNDEKQGKSYARLRDDIARLTIMTNGDETRIINIHTCEALRGDIRGYAKQYNDNYL